MRTLPGCLPIKRRRVVLKAVEAGAETNSGPCLEAKTGVLSVEVPKPARSPRRTSQDVKHLWICDVSVPDRGGRHFCACVTKCPNWSARSKSEAYGIGPWCEQKEYQDPRGRPLFGMGPPNSCQQGAQNSHWGVERNERWECLATHNPPEDPYLGNQGHPTSPTDGSSFGGQVKSEFSQEYPGKKPH